MLIVPLSPDRHLTAGMNFVLVCALSAKATLHNCRRSERVGWHRLTSARDHEAMRAVPGRGRAVCSATRLSLCVPTSGAFATSALIQGCTQVLELSEGGSNGNRARNAYAAAVAMRASAANSLLLTLAVSSCTTHFLSSPSRQFYLWALQSRNSRDICQHN